MSYQTDPLTKCLIIYITHIRALTPVYALMWYQTALLTECLITHITCISALILMYALMFKPKCSVDWMPYYTYHTYKGAHPYVRIDVLTNCSVDWMPYYIHHKYKAVHQYVCVHVLSDCSVDWMPYYTIHMNMEAHPYVYHKNIRIQHCVEEVVHSVCPGKITKFKH
jgi:hypothetical protein